MADIKTIQDVLMLVESGRIDRITITKSHTIEGVKVHLLKNISGDRIVQDESYIPTDQFELSRVDVGVVLFNKTVQRLEEHIEQYSK